ncbi:hypothetical protein A3A09_00455 [Candidatus Nomurabacteria bacterium RIFCSPLOWO2_01_FULL_42_20]|uniref:DUF559 domain-containing protein n=1 Tax=Candidatus Nomurabacteria bacterium RIFCSPHIGHO2_01_FULL_42_16 TaxID=1801743 RepID=A0A1F6VIX1_9BACT|nr:MAG: hypothetical protein A2824_02675 [Candidatus Nomurabacteria bacterium RIFCSPHIGHO2_01_FULL_42_16]OGI91894.1 MAG: hypothetical protein A3A09_00455 [Candidatus Nomurabacteria bacterium RIFCSPLOWO2_01_FULL_42_20]
MTTINNILKLKKNRIVLRNNQTPQEKILWSRLRREQLGFKFRRQHSIGNYIADFYCSPKKLIIEIDGSQHFKEKNQQYDEKRSQYFNKLKIKVLRFTNTEINNNIEGVVLKIINTLRTPPQSSPYKGEEGINLSSVLPLARGGGITFQQNDT